MSASEPDFRKGALAGLAAGFAASLAMDGFQRLFARPRGKDAAGARHAGAGLAHYATGIGIGLAYGLAAEYAPEVTKGAGTAFSSGVAGLLEEGPAPALRLLPPPWEAHADNPVPGVASQLLFGLVAEATRRAARALADRVIS